MSHSSASVSNHDVARGFRKSIVARLGAVIDIAVQPLYLSLFGLAGYGLYAALWAAIDLIETFADFGVTTALQRTVPQAADDRAATTALRAAMLIGVLPCLLLGMAISLGAPHIAHVFNAAVGDEDELVTFIRLFAWALPLWALVEISASALRARQAFGPEIRLRTFWEQITRLGLALMFYLMGFGLLSLILAHLLSLLFIACLCIRLLGRYYRLEHFFAPGVPGQMRETLGSGLASLPSNCVTQLYSAAPPIVLNAWLPGAAGAIAAGLYTVARKLSSIVFLVRSATGYVLSPLASSAHRSREEIAAIYSYSVRIITVLVLPIGACLFGGGTALLGFFGDGAAAALGPMVMLVAARMIDAVLGLATAVLLVVGDYRQRLLGSFMGLGATILCGALLLPASAETGAALAVAVGIVTNAVVASVQLYRRQEIQPFDGQFRLIFLRGGLISALAGGSLTLIQEAPKPLWLVLFAVVCLASLWLSARFSLSFADRRSFGRTGRRLKLVPETTKGG